MTFQFQCPQGHLLQGEEAQAGHTINCPLCNVLFIIPQPLGAPAAMPQIGPGFGPSAGPPAFGPPPGIGPPSHGPAVPEEPPPPEILHIPCPAGHILDTPEEMLDQEVLCPKCGVQFRLRRKDSVEFKKKKEEQDELRQIKLGNQWASYAIAAAVLVVLLLLGLVVMSQMNK